MRPLPHVLALLALALTASATATQPTRAPVSVPEPAAFATGGGLYGVQLSPDGTRVAGMVRTSEIRGLVVRNLDGSDRRVVYWIDKPDLDLTLVRWAGADRLLLKVSEHSERRRIAEWNGLPVTRLVAIDLEGKLPRVLLDPHADGWTNHSAQELAAACPSAPGVWLPGEGSVPVRMDALTARGTPARAVPTDARAYWIDGSDTVRLARIDARGATRYRWRNADQRWQDWTPPTASADASVGVLGLEPDGQRAVAWVRAEVGQPLRLVRWDLSGQAPEERLAELPEDTSARELALLRHESGCHTVGVRATQTTFTWGDQLPALVGGIQAALPDSSVQLLQWQGDRYLLERGGPGLPTQYLVGQRSTGQLQLVSEAYPQLPNELPVRTEKGSAGSLNWRWTTDPNASGPRPVIVCVDCDLLAGRFDAFRPLVARWVAQGFGVLEVLKAPAAEGDLKGLRLAGQREGIRQALALALDRGWSNGKVALVAGHANASLVALGYAARHPQQIQAVATWGAVTDLEQMLRERSRDRDRGKGVVAEVAQAPAPWKREESLSPHAAALTMPVLLMHAEIDGVSRPEQSQALADLLRAQGAPVQTLLLKASSNGLEHPAYRLQVTQALDHLLAPLLPTPP